MAAELKINRILLWSALFLGLAVAFAFLVNGRSKLLPTPVCKPLPPNIEKLGDALSQQSAAAALESHARDSNGLKSAIRPGDTIHTFETGVTGGHLVLRDKCYIGQAVSWIR